MNVEPFADRLIRVLLMQDYNTRVVLLGTLLLGVCAGTVGTFMLMRKRSLVGDVVGHASLPGIGIAFLVMEALSPGSGKWLPGLLAGALLAGVAGVLCTMLIRRQTRIREDAALAIVLSVFFGFGIVLFTVIQKLPTGNAAGLNEFIFGKAASMVADDVKLIAGAAAIVLAVSILLFKELSLLCFDEDFAAAQGWPVVVLDTLLMLLVAGVAVIGLQSVGLLLVVGMLIIPAAAARFWTDNLRKMTFAAATLGGLGSFCGVVISALFPRLAAGAVIVLVGAFFFVLSLLCGTRRGVLRRMLIVWQTKRRVGRLDLLRAIYECVEAAAASEGVVNGEWREKTGSSSAAFDVDSLTEIAVPFEQLLSSRSWTARRLNALLRSAANEGLLRCGRERCRLTDTGASEAQRIVRNHRLWEIYLINYADIAPGHVDRNADRIEHVLGRNLVAELETLLAEQHAAAAVPPSPHPIEQLPQLAATSTTVNPPI